MGVRRKIFFMAKSELFTDHGRLAGAFLKICGVFPVKRGTADTASVDRASELLEKGRIVGIFPQGGIFRSDAFVPKAGAALLATKNHVPIVPVSVFSEGRVRPFAKITVRFGEPVFSEGSSLRDARRLNVKMRTRISEQLEEGH